MADPNQPGDGPAGDPLIGRSLGGHYQIRSLLGRGGMSRVYRAVQSPLERAVAVKVLKDDPEDPSLKKRFLFEASITAQLTHPNTITVFDYGADAGMLYFAMELLSGSTISAALRRDGRFSEERTLHIARQICRSLRQAHAMGLVHRDLKPSNLFLLDRSDEADFVKVLDFGLVKVTGREELDERLTPGGSLLGTPHYMAPEQARGKPCDERADIYSLGAVLFQMLGGRPPYVGSSSVDVLVAHATEPVPLLRATFPELQISEELEAVVARCLAKSPNDRFRNMDEVLSALPGEHHHSRPPALPLGWDAASGPLPLQRDPLATPPIAKRTPPSPAVLLPAQPPPSSPKAEPPLQRMTPPSVQRAPAAQPDAAAPLPAPVLPPAPAKKTGRGVIAGVVLAAAALGAAALWMRPARPVEAAVNTPSPKVTLGLGSAAKREGAPPSAATEKPAAPAAEPAAVSPPPPQTPAVTPALPAVLPDALPAVETPLPPPAATAEPAAPAPVKPAPMKVAAPAARPALKEAKVATKQTSPEVVAALEERLGRAVSGVRQCALLERLAGGAAEGALELIVTVDPQGHAELELASGRLGRSLEACVRAAVKRVKFDPFDGARPVKLQRKVSLATGG